MSANSQFSSTDEVDALTDYEPVDRLSLTSLFLGIASVFALIHPLLWAVPILGASLALYALRRIATQNRQSGRTLAMSGLGLALLFGSFAITWSLSADAVLSRQSRQFCEIWLDTIREGKAYEAHQLTLYHDERLTADDPIDEIYTELAEKFDDDSGKLMQTDTEEPGGFDTNTNPQQLAMSFSSWRMTDPIDKLIEFGTDVGYQYERRMGTVQSPSNYQARHLYRIDYKDDGRSRSLPLEIVIDRVVDEGIAHWRITSAQKYTENL